MGNRKEFEMTDEQLNKILDACKPVPYMVFGGMEPPSQRENANRAWQALGKELGFVWDTVEPINGKGSKFFTAIPN
jgi:hypothetical protein